MRKLENWIKNAKREVLFAVAAALGWGLAAHGYAYSDSNHTHDSLRELHAEILGNDAKMTSGRIFTPIYRELLGSDVAMPWFSGLLALIWIGLAVFLLARILAVKSDVTVLLMAGIFTTNLSVSAITATYIHDLDSYMFAMLCAVVAVYCWRAASWGWLAGSVWILASLGIYQGFIFLAVTLVMIVCIMDLLKDGKFRRIFSDGMKAIGMIVLGGILYILAMKVLMPQSGAALSTGRYNSLDRMGLLASADLVSLLIDTYRNFFARLMTVYTGYPAIMVRGITVVLLAVCGAAVLAMLLDRNKKLPEKALFLLLVVLLPFGMNLIYFVTARVTHDLMVFPIWMFYLLALLLAQWLQQRLAETGKWKAYLAIGQKWLCTLLAFVLLFGNVRFSNGMYLKKDLEHDAYLSLMTRVVANMEMLDGYVPGQTEVVFVGFPESLHQTMPGFKDYWDVTGMTNSGAVHVSDPSVYQAFFDYFMGMPIRLVKESAWDEISERETVQQMPGYPAKGCMAFEDDILVVKLG